MTLDSLVSSLGSSARNLAAHTLLLVQQQQQAHPSQHAGAVGAAPAGCGGAQALLQCCYHRLSHGAQQRTRGVIVLSLEFKSRVWQQHASATPAPQCDSAPPRLILDACRNRFPVGTSAEKNAASLSQPAAPVDGVAVQTLAHHEIHSLTALRTIVLSAAQDMHARFEATQRDRSTAAVPAADSTAAPVAAAAVSNDPYSVADDTDVNDSYPCDCVHVLIDSVMTLVARFGSSATLAFLQALKSSPQRLSVLAGVDLDGLASVSPLQVGSGTGNTQSQHSSVSIHAHLASLATTTVSIRALRLAVAAPASTAATLASDALLATVNVLHHRTSGRITHVAEEVEIQPSRGVVRKISATAVAAAAAAAPSQQGGAVGAGASGAASLAHQFGSSFSLDLTSKARSARAQTVLPYQHTGAHGDDLTGATTASSIDEVDDGDDIISDDDHDADDPDDDLDV